MDLFGPLHGAADTEGYEVVKYGGLNSNGAPVLAVREAAVDVWKLIRDSGAEGLVLDTCGLSVVEDPNNFWINVYEELLGMTPFSEYARHLTVIIWSRYLTPEKIETLERLGVPRDRILDRFNNTPEEVLAHFPR